MKIGCLATMIALTIAAQLGCGGGDSADTADFEIAGPWAYLGPWDGEHTLTISNESVKYAGINANWASSWTLKSHDNKLHHFQIVFDSGNGTYYPAGQDFSGAYVSDGVILTVQLAKGLGSYPQMKNPDTCIDADSSLIPDCRRYMKQQ